eukprot:3442897-Rhodomonas_salina.1
MSGPSTAATSGKSSSSGSNWCPRTTGSNHQYFQRKNERPLNCLYQDAASEAHRDASVQGPLEAKIAVRGCQSDARAASRHAESGGKRISRGI